jgi:pimeloyl-ACP methyl ester carboxylesterase
LLGLALHLEMKSLALLFSGIILIMSPANSTAEPSVSYHFLRVDGLDIFYREAGPKDAPTILLLHGLPSSSRMYQPLLESSLSEKYHLIAPDYPGFGHSSWPDHKDFAYTFDHLAIVMQDFADQLHLDRHTLFMQDYGGPVGFRMALAHPEKVQAMIIQNAVSHEEGLSPLWAVRRARTFSEKLFTQRLLRAARQRARTRSRLAPDFNAESHNSGLSRSDHHIVHPVHFVQAAGAGAEAEAVTGL